MADETKKTYTIRLPEKYAAQVENHAASMNATPTTLLQSLIAQSAEGTAVFFSSHQISEVERIADHVCMLEKGRLVLDVSLDEMRQSYRQIDCVFPALPAEHEFQIAGVESVRAKGLQLSVFTNGNTEAIVERARDLHASSIQVAPVGLREMFLEKVKEN